MTDVGLEEYVNARDWAIEDMTTDGNRMIDRTHRNAIVATTSW